jgi:TonB family protein
LPASPLQGPVGGLKSPPPELFPTYCFSEEKPILRTGTSLGGNQFVTNEIVLFQNRYIPKFVQINSYENPVLQIRVDQLTGLDQTDRATLEPPPHASTMEAFKKIGINSGVVQGDLLKKVQPVYPPDAKARQAQGTVVIRATIGTDGHIGYLSVVSAPDELLAKAAAYAVKQWEFKPFLRKGVPVEVMTQINVVFHLGR